MCDFVAGWVGGCCGLVLGHPFDTLKVRQQALGYSSIVQTTLNCMKQDGMRSLFRGLSYPLLSTGAINSLFFGIYGTTLRKLDNRDRPSYTSIFLAGCVGGAGQLVIACPVDLVKVKLQVTSGETYKGPLDCIIKIYKAEGIRGCYRGLLPQALRDIKASGLYFLIYQWTLDKMMARKEEKNAKILTIPTKSSKTRLAEAHTLDAGSTDARTLDTTRTGGPPEPGPIDMFLAGGLAGLLSWQAIIYLDVIKTRIQSDNPRHPQYSGMLDCARKSYRQSGLSVFSRGFVLMSLRAFPLNGATFLGYEYCMKLCRQSF